MAITYSLYHRCNAARQTDLLERTRACDQRRQVEQAALRRLRDSQRDVPPPAPGEEDFGRMFSDIFGGPSDALARFSQAVMDEDEKLISRAQVRAKFEAAGISISDWAKANGFSRMAVVDVLRGKRVGLYGECHRVAVALGLKDGKVVDAAKFDPSAPAHKPTTRKGGR